MNDGDGGWPPLDNPFATRWVSPGAIRFQFPAGDSLAGFLERLELHRRRGAIVGPHGTGKSTLITTLAAHCETTGVAVRVCRVRETSRPSLPAIVSAARSVSGGYLIVDGFEACGALLRRATHWACHNHRCGLVVSTHAATFLPTLIQTTSSLRLATELAHRLWQDGQHRLGPGMTCDPLQETLRPAGRPDEHGESWPGNFPLPPERINECYQHSAGNLREFFFALYDDCERLRRERRRRIAGG